MKDNLLKHINNLSDKERLLLVRKQVNSCLSNLNKRDKASNAEFNHSGDRGGRNSSRNQTLYSNSYNTARMYDGSIDDLKKIVKLI